MSNFPYKILRCRHIAHQYNAIIKSPKSDRITRAPTFQLFPKIREQYFFFSFLFFTFLFLSSFILNRMKCTSSFTALLSASTVLATPSVAWSQHYTNSTTPPYNTTVPSNTTIPTNSTTSSNTTGSGLYSGFIRPTLLKTHDVVTNQNIQSAKTVTVRQGIVETSTLYEIPVPESLAGKTCSLVIRASHLSHGDAVLGAQAMDIFRNDVESLAQLRYGNHRDVQLARVRFDERTGLYGFDATVLPPAIKSFPCPAGKTLEWESVAVGDYDVNIIQQNFHLGDEKGVPNGLSIGYY
jgi:hypothetical protein